jgi:hypothetical protein
LTKSGPTGSNNNVITLSKIKNSATGPLTPEKIDNGVEAMKVYHVHAVMEALIPMLFSQLYVAGFNFSESTGPKDSILISESIRSLLFRHYGIYHPVQKIADALFVESDDPDMMYDMPKSLNIDDLLEDKSDKSDE